MRGKRAVDRLRDESLLDQATGLYNMQGMVRRAREMSADAQRLRAPISCVAFTPVATTETEPTPPAITEIMIERLGAIVRRTGRASDAIGRLGPTEFAIIAPSTEEPGAIRMMERLESQLSDMMTTQNGIAQRVELRAGYCSVSDGAQIGSGCGRDAASREHRAAPGARRGAWRSAPRLRQLAGQVRPVSSPTCGVLRGRSSSSLVV